jgi:poly-gamma-glutamate synthesis protein (capsule biosynthesis protein)
MKKFFAFLFVIFALMGIFSVKANEKQKLSFAFVGDILLAGQAGRIMQATGNLNYPFEKVASVLSKADITFGNLECALTGNEVTRNVHQGANKWFCFKTPPKMGKSLVFAGFDIVSLANNHSMNGGEKGMIETIETLNKSGIKYVGGGRNYEEAHALKIIEAKGLKIGFLAYAAIGGPAATKNRPGIAWPNNIYNEVSAAKSKVDILIVSLHWGIEGTNQPTEEQRKFAKKLIDAGADIIIGHHPHRLQPVEIYKGKIIAYSLGNFVFDNPRPASCQTVILWVEVDGQKNITYKKIPCYIKNAQPQLVE